MQNILSTLLMMVTVFPVVVALMVSVTFILGGHGVGWQWWASVILAMVIGWKRAENPKHLLASGGLFLLFLLMVWVVARVTITFCSGDAAEYHLAATRMMIEGWNPVWQGTAAGMKAAVGVDPDMFRYFHVLAMPRVVWYFNAASYVFVSSALNLHFAIAPFLLFSVGIAIWRAFRNDGLCVVIVLFVILASSGPSYSGSVDFVVKVSGIWLLTLFFDALRNGRWNRLEMVVALFWMMVAKQTSLLTGFVFMALFCVACCWRYRCRLVWVFKVGALAVAFWMVASISPYVTAAVEFGHPLYPRYTACDKYPVVNIVADFLDRNDDAKEMGQIGSFVNSFVSAQLARVYYRLKTGREDFMPRVWVWDHGLYGEAGSPTSHTVKICMCVAAVLILVLGGMPERLLLVFVIAGCFVVPTEMIGYLRYVPWWIFVYMLALSLVMRCLHVRYARLGLFACAIFTFAPRLVVDVAYNVDSAYAAKCLLHDAPPKELFVQFSKNNWDGKDLGTLSPFPARARAANSLMLIKEVPELCSACLAEEVVPEDQSRRFFDWSFQVSPEVDLDKYCAYYRLMRFSGVDKLCHFPLFLLRTYLVTLPRSFLI